MPGYTPNYQIPYPASGDQIASSGEESKNLRNDMKALALKADASMKAEAATLEARLTASSSAPVSLNNRASGHLHVNEATGEVWIATLASGALAWQKMQGQTVYRGRPANTENLDGWAAASRNGEWEIQDYASMDALTAAGSTFPMREPGRFRHFVSGIGIVYQEYEVYGPKQALYRRTSTGWNTGKLTPWQRQAVDRAASATDTIVAVGDSLTEGGANNVVWPKTDAWPAKLATALGQTVLNHGVSGSTVDEALLNTGARPMRLKVTGGSVPASGGVAVELSWAVHTYTGKWIAATGRMGGLTVTLQRNGTTGAWTVFQNGGTAAKALTGWHDFTPDWSGQEANTFILWHGANDATYNVTGREKTAADHIVAGIQELASHLAARNKRYVMLGLHTRTVDTTGTSRHTTATEVNTRLRYLDPGHFLSVQDWMRDRALAALGITPTTQDLDLIAAGTVPASIMEGADTTHISKPAAAALATDLLVPWLQAKGYAHRV